MIVSLPLTANWQFIFTNLFSSLQSIFLIYLVQSSPVLLFEALADSSSAILLLLLTVSKIPILTIILSFSCVINYNHSSITRLPIFCIFIVSEKRVCLTFSYLDSIYNISPRGHSIINITITYR